MVQQRPRQSSGHVTAGQACNTGRGVAVGAGTVSYRRRGTVTRASARTTPVAGSRCTGTYRPQSASPAVSQPPRGAGGFQHATGERAAQESDDHSGTSIRRDSPASPLGGARHPKDSTGAPATSVPAPAAGRRRGCAAGPAAAQPAERAPIPGRGRTAPIPPVPYSFTPARGHGQSGRNGDVSTPTTGKPRGGLRERGDGPSGRATVGATLVATSSATARRNPCRNPVLLVDRGARSRGPDGSPGAGHLTRLGARGRHRGDGLPVGVPPQPYGQEQSRAGFTAVRLRRSGQGAGAAP